MPISHIRIFGGGRSSCKRSFLLDNGIFNNKFTFGCEDIELAWRLKSHGLRVIYEPLAISTMIREITFDQFCNRSYRQGRSQVLFSELHKDPEIQIYCEINDSLRAWSRWGGFYDAQLQWTRNLDKLSNTRCLDQQSDNQESLMDTLFKQYENSFYLSKAKGIFDEKSKL